jgi:CheY-like chemotaxis protein
MEAENTKKLVFHADFVFNPEAREIVFAVAPSSIIPVAEGLKLSLDTFLSAFVKSDQATAADFFAPATWSGNCAFFTMSTAPDNHLKGESCSVFIQQGGKLSDNSFSGSLVNISMFLPGEFLYRDLSVFVDGLANIRRITHDLNNQFQIITGFGSALEDEMTDPELKECATNVMDAVGKAIDQNKDLRKFFPPKDKPKLYVPRQIKADNQSATHQAPADSCRPAVSGAPVSASATTNVGILVIDDEPLVQRFLCEMLKRLKYNPLGCTTGMEAINALRDNQATYSMAIVDMNLPDIASETLFDQLKQLRNDLKVILISGDNLGESSQRIIDKGANGFLQKPTTIKTLSETISQILSETSASA